jgi:hypothetical protein
VEHPVSEDAAGSLRAHDLRLAAGSPSRHPARCSGRLRRLIEAHAAIDLVAEAPAEGPDGLGLGVARRQTLGQVGLASAGSLEQADGDAVEARR